MQICWERRVVKQRWAWQSGRRYRCRLHGGDGFVQSGHTSTHCQCRGEAAVLKPTPFAAAWKTCFCLTLSSAAAIRLQAHTAVPFQYRCDGDCITIATAMGRDQHSFFHIPCSPPPPPLFSSFFPSSFFSPSPPTDRFSFPIPACVPVSPCQNAAAKQICRCIPRR